MTAIDMPQAMERLPNRYAIAIAGSVALLVSLALLIRAVPESGVETAVMSGIRSLSAPGLDRLMASVSRFTEQPGLMLGPVAALLFVLTGRIREALVFTGVVLLVGVLVFAVDLALGEIAERGRPLPYETRPSYPSGHTSGSTWFFVFLMYLAVRSGMTELGKGLVTGGLGSLVLLVGVSRVFLHRHWPLDVVGGYALGILAGLLAIWLFEQFRDRRSTPVTRLSV